MPCHSERQPDLVASTTISAIKRIMTVWLSVLCLAIVNAQANPADRTKPINISADSSEYNDIAGTQVLAGNVEISQGSMVIRADRITVELKDNTLYKITGSGSPIRFQQLTENNELMRGQSEQISYNTKTSEITFSGNAEFEKPGQKFTGHSINYNIAELTFKAAGNDNGRVNIVLQPRR